MTIQELIDAVEHKGVAKVGSRTSCREGILYSFEGRVLTPPCGTRLTTYQMTVRRADENIDPDQIDALLRHFWQGQLELSDSERSVGTKLRDRVEKSSTRTD